MMGPSPDSDEGRARNISYMRDRLAPIILEFERKHATVPDLFSEAHEESGVRLPHRGDYYGR